MQSYHAGGPLRASESEKVQRKPWSAFDLERLSYACVEKRARESARNHRTAISSCASLARLTHKCIHTSNCTHGAEGTFVCTEGTSVVSYEGLLLLLICWLFLWSPILPLPLWVSEWKLNLFWMVRKAWLNPADGDWLNDCEPVCPAGISMIIQKLWNIMDQSLLSFLKIASALILW